MLRSFLVERDTQSVDPIIFGMRSDEFNKRDMPAEVESNNHPKIAASDFEPHAFAIQYLCIRRCTTDIIPLNSNWRLWLMFSIDEAVLLSPDAARQMLKARSKR
jgi:hypothetical protein